MHRRKLAKARLPGHKGRMTQVLLSFGHGYSAQALARLLLPHGWRIIGTTRDPAKAAHLAETGIEPVIWGDDLSDAFSEATHLLDSAGPSEAGDPVLARYRAEITALAPGLDWAGYLSTTGVYGDHQGGWVDEETPLAPTTQRGRLRVAAEADWQSIPALPLHIFRLAGIYGPGRGPFEKVRQGTARRIVKPGQVFSRIHVEDIAQALAASIARPRPGAVYNLCDDDPAPPEAVPYDAADLSPMARSFYAESKRVSNRLLKEELGVTLRHPDYRSGLAALLAEGD